VVMAASWPHSTTKRIFSEQQRVNNEKDKLSLLATKMQETVEVIVNSGAVPVFIQDTPTLGGKSPKCSVKKLVFNQNLDCSITRKNNTMMDDILGDLSITYPQLMVLNFHQLYCLQNDCRMDMNDVPLYRDDDHFNEQGAKYLGKVFLEKFGSPFIELK